MLPGKLKIYALGLFSGAVLLANWRPVAKSTIKVGVQGMSVLREAAARGMESLADVAQEAMWEIREDDGEPDGGGAPAHVNGTAVVPKEQVATRL